MLLSQYIKKLLFKYVLYFKFIIELYFFYITEIYVHLFNFFKKKIDSTMMERGLRI
jgi:hypothetical protein